MTPRVLTGENLDEFHDEARRHAAQRTDPVVEVDRNQKERDSSSPSERVVDSTHQRFQNVYAGVVFVFGCNQRPGRLLGAGSIDHLGGGDLVSSPLLSVSPILAGDLVTLEPCLLAGQVTHVRS